MDNYEQEALQRLRETESLFCEYCGESFCDCDEDEFDDDKPLGYDDPNCCDECGADLSQDGFCWECDF